MHVQVYCDFHGHSQIKNVVLFACPDPSGGVATEVSKTVHEICNEAQLLALSLDVTGIEVFIHLCRNLDRPFICDYAT